MNTLAKKLFIHDLHVEAKGHLGLFGEWEVPLYFTSILEEHEAVRTKAGLFDISHMGEFFVTGRQARGFLDYVLPRKMERLKEGKALYSPMLNEKGGIVDDLIVYQIHPEKFLLIVNAGNVEKDFNWLRTELPAGIELENRTDELFLFALQGPRALGIAKRLFNCDFEPLGYYHFLSRKTAWGELLISRTGYTGEDGLEIMGEAERAADIWQALFEAGKPDGLKPAGFGARDTLRLEAAMLLYGQDLDDTTSPLEAGIGWAVDLDKENFTGKERLEREKKEGVSRKLAGFEMTERGIPRHGFEIRKGEKVLGSVASGSPAPTLKKNIGLAYVPAAEAAAGNELEIMIRERPVKAKIVKTPFYKRK